jgi:hypothetical protein
MALLGKERAFSPTPNTITVGTSATVATQANGIAKALASKVSKPEPFYGSR